MSKGISNKQEAVGDPFDRFLETLPKELVIGENYRMKAAWKAYGSPSDYKEALWEGMIQPIDENTYKLPSIGYNEETDEYEYLNKGKENETVAKDIRVWDNDVIPFVQELKRGGFIRVYNEEKDCWTYSKNKSQENQEINSFAEGGEIEKNKKIKIENSPGYITIDEEKLTEDQKAGKEPVGELGQEKLYLINGKVFFEKDLKIESHKQGGQMSVIPEGALHARKNNMEGAGEDFTAKGIPVVDNEGEQQAEIERDEIIFRKEITDKMEELYKKFNSEESSDKKDEIAIEMGKIITCEITKHTQDNTGLIDKIQNQE